MKPKTSSHTPTLKEGKGPDINNTETLKVVRGLPERVNEPETPHRITYTRTCMNSPQ